MSGKKNSFVVVIFCFDVPTRRRVSGEGLWGLLGIGAILILSSGSAVMEGAESVFTPSSGVKEMVCILHRWPLLGFR